MYKDFSVKYRIILGFTCVLAIMAAAVLTINSQFSSVSKSAHIIKEKLSSQVTRAYEVRYSAEKRKTGLRSYLLTGEKRFYYQYQGAVKNQRVAVESLLKTVDDPSCERLIADIDSQDEVLERIELYVIKLSARGKRDYAYQVQQKRLAPLIGLVEAKASEIETGTSNQIKDALGSFENVSSRSLGLARAFFGIALLSSIFFVVITVRSVAYPAKHIAKAASSILKGDYESAIALDSGYSSDKTLKKRVLPRNELLRIAVSLSEMSRVLQKREKTLSSHGEIGDVCTSTIELDDLVNSVLVEYAEHTSSQVAAAYMLWGSELSVLGTYAIDREAASSAISGSGSIVEQSIRSQKPVILSDIPEDTKFTINPGIGKAVPKSIACVPMIVNGVPTGAIVAASIYGYDDDMISFMESSVKQIGIAINNALRHKDVENLVDKLQSKNDQLDAQNEVLICQNEEMQAQNEEIQAQNEEIQAQNEELAAQGTELMERNRQLESRTNELLALQSIASVAMSSLDKDELLKRMLETAISVLNLHFGLVMLHDEETGTLRSWIGHNAGAQEVLELRVGEGFIGKIADKRQITAIADAQAEPDLMIPRIEALGVRGLIGVPLVADETLYGVAILGSMEHHRFREKEYQLLKVFSERAAIAIDRARSYEKLKLAEANARSQREWLQTIIDNLPEAVVIASAPNGHIELVNKVAMSLYGLESIPESSSLVHSEVFNFYSTKGEPIPGNRLPISRSLDGGEVCKGDEILIRQPSGREIVVLCNSAPMTDNDGNVTCAIGVFQDITTIKDLQSSLKQGYEHQRLIAETFQKSFLPNVPSVVGGYEIGDAYIPAQQDAQVGGDFYDIFDLGDGKLGIVMADVSGKGIGAAIYTAMVKYMLRGFACEDSKPTRVLKRLNDAITKFICGEVFVTLFYGVLDTETKVMAYANAGHEQPIILKSETGERCSLQGTGPAIGIIPDCIYTEAEFILSDNDTLVLYTDGLTEARCGKEFLGQDGLEDIVSGIGDAGSSVMTSEILAKVRDFTGGSFNDDVALVVIRPRCTQVMV